MSSSSITGSTTIPPPPLHLVAAASEAAASWRRAVPQGVAALLELSGLDELVARRPGHQPEHHVQRHVRRRPGTSPAVLRSSCCLAPAAALVSSPAHGGARWQAREIGDASMRGWGA